MEARGLQWERFMVLQNITTRPDVPLAHNQGRNDSGTGRQTQGKLPKAKPNAAGQI
jgi:hypothetical protein